MSRKKYNGKLELFQDLYDNLGDLREQLDMALEEINMTHLEEKDFRAVVLNSYDALLLNLETFVTDVNNGTYEEEENVNDFEEE
jgi:hypothetical protein